MNHRLSAVTMLVITILTLAAVSSVAVDSVFAGSYEKSQNIVQTNECGNYWFPVNVICSNLNSQIHGEKNSIAITTAPVDGSMKSGTTYGTPFP